MSVIGDQGNLEGKHLYQFTGCMSAAGNPRSHMIACVKSFLFKYYTLLQKKKFT